MAYIAVVSYPSLEPADRQWIESIRAAHDPQATLLAAHFTFVFPAAVEPNDVAAEIAVAAATVTPIPFVIRSAEAVRAVFQPGGGHVFLVAGEGAGAISALHDLLYAGVLKSHRRDDIPFVPHITVAANADFARCEAIARDVNRNPRTVAGTLEALDLLEMAKGSISSRRRFPLGST